MKKAENKDALMDQRIVDERTKAGGEAGEVYITADELPSTSQPTSFTFAMLDDSPTAPGTDLLAPGPNTLGKKHPAAHLNRLKGDQGMVPGAVVPSKSR